MSRRRRDEAGYAALLVAVLVPVVFLGLAAVAVDTARWYVEVERVQKAADAGALAGVTFMPQSLDDARTMARDITARNGYADGDPDVDVAVSAGHRPSQLRVRVSSRVDNTFGAAIGLPSTTITRTALTDFTGPAPMGSPCNALGNEPPGSPGAGPVGSQIGLPEGASCPTSPQYWMTAAGPRVHKTQGDRYGVRVCAGGEFGCTGTANDEYKPEGYFLLVRVQPAQVNLPVRVQVYDPAYVDTDSRCSSRPAGNDFPNGLANWNPYATTDGNIRYRRSPNHFCTGDNDNAGLRDGAETRTVTSFGLRAPTDTYNPLEADPVPGCAAQFDGYTSLIVDNLRDNKTAYSQTIARVFHQWVDLCTFTPTRPGDYYLQIRTNVRLGGTVSATTGAYRGANADRVYTQVGDDPTEGGNGSNRFSVRAVSSVPTAVSVSSWGDMPIFANSDQATPVFNLIRVLPGAAGKNLIFKFFDAGDAASDGTLTVLRPTEATGAELTGCRGEGFYTGPLASCQVTGIRNENGWNGQAETIVVPIPADYGCNWQSAGGCWFRVQVNFGSGSVTDQTTWSASVSGDPVRLLE